MQLCATCWHGTHPPNEPFWFSANTVASPARRSGAQLMSTKGCVGWMLNGFKKYQVMWMGRRLRLYYKRTTKCHWISQKANRWIGSWVWIPNNKHWTLNTINRTSWTLNFNAMVHKMLTWHPWERPRKRPPDLRAYAQRILYFNNSERVCAYIVEAKYPVHQRRRTRVYLHCKPNVSLTPTIQSARILKQRRQRYNKLKQETPKAQPRSLSACVVNLKFLAPVRMMRGGGGQQ